MSRRVALPGANELFRSTDDTPRQRPASAAPATAPTAASSAEGGARRGSGRVRHDEKITVYVSSDELLAIEAARLELRGQGMAVDRGRLVREAIAMALEDLDANGADSEIVRRLNR